MGSDAGPHRPGVVVLALLIASLLSWNTEARAQTAKPAEARCGSHLRDLHRALLSYHHDTGTYPAHLDALFPRYVRDRSLFDCPVTATATGRRAPSAKTGLPEKQYIYELDAAVVLYSSRPLGPILGWTREQATTYLDLRMSQRQFFGDWIPLLRCRLHRDTRPRQANVLNTGINGSLYWSGRDWHHAPEVVRSFLGHLDRRVRAQRKDLSINDRWVPDEIADYLTELRSAGAAPSDQRPRLAAIARALAHRSWAIRGGVPLEPGARAYLLATLYDAGGDLPSAVAWYTKAGLESTPERLQYVRRRFLQLAEVQKQPRPWIRFLDQLVRAHPENPTYMRWLAEALRRNGNQPKAAQWELRSVLGEGRSSVGILDAPLTTTEGSVVRLRELFGGKRAMLVLTGTDPFPGEIARLSSLWATVSQTEVAAIAIVPIGEKPIGGLPFPWVYGAPLPRDDDEGVALRCFVVDRAGRICYSGPIEPDKILACIRKWK